MFMHWLKKLSIITVSVLAFSNTVSATVVNLSYGYTPGAYAVGRDGKIGTFSFEDTFNLNIQTPAYFSFSLLEDTSDPAYDIVNGSLSYTFFKDSAPVAFSNNSLLGVGFYQILVTGNVSGPFGGQYFLNTNVSATPVPEPSSGLVMMLGLGLIGLLSIRKSHFIK